MLGKVEKARDAYKTVQDLEPDSEQAKQGVNVCEEMLEEEMMIAFQNMFN